MREIDQVCEELAPKLQFSFGLDKVSILMALSGVESSFGTNNRPRFEPAYAPNGHYYKRSEKLRALVEKYGEDASCSWGPWQILACVADELGYEGDPKNLSDARVSGPYCVMLLNRIFNSGAQTMEQVLDAYNTGSFRSGEFPKEYVSRFWAMYGRIIDERLKKGEEKMEKQGIQNLKELSTLVLEIGMGVEKSLSDGKVSFADAFNFKDALFAVLPAIKDISLVDDEYFDLDDAEMEELKAHISSKLQLSSDNENVEYIVESVLSVILSMNGLLQSLLQSKS